ncbi:hypothetical protein BD626DRAFT_579081 [Schizophyllum amplum]|uniref:Cytochrome P450 n=1 Tax=Schizophyllum amplum TaxID=97359 RepID=A0A550BRP9_9AGAR|nr:hypothetical protein BD626DRAFT_579081 [Auriculariopsis ampla]
MSLPFSSTIFGRRICPGRLLADASVFITVATCLAVLDIGPAEQLMPEFKTYGRPVE